MRNPITGKQIWKRITLEHVCKTIYRYPTFYGFEQRSSGVPVVRGEHLCDGRVSTNWSSYWYVTPEESALFPKTVLEAGDIVMSVRGSVGTFALVGPEHHRAQISPNLIRIQPNPLVVEPGFLFFALGLQIERFVATAKQAQALPSLSAGEIKEIEFDLPPIGEQRMIAEILRSWDYALDTLTRAIKGKQRLLQALFTHLLRDLSPELVQLGTVSTIVGGQHVLAPAVNEEGHGVPYLTGPSDFTETGIRSTKFTVAGRSFCKEGDMLLTVKGSGVGSYAVAERDYAISRQLMAIRAQHGYDQDFLTFAVASTVDSLAIQAKGTIPGLTRADLQALLIPKPPIAVQRDMAKVRQTSMEELSLLRRMRTALEQQKRGLMQELLTGALRVQPE